MRWKKNVRKRGIPGDINTQLRGSQVRKGNEAPFFSTLKRLLSFGRCRSLPSYLHLGVIGFVATACGENPNQNYTDANIPPLISNDEVALPEFSCSATPAQGCEAGEKCAPLAQEWTCQADGTRVLGQECFADEVGDNCQAGLYCYRGSCHALCKQGDDCDTADSDAQNSQSYACVGIDGDTPALRLCLSQCQVIEQDCPRVGDDQRQACYLLPSGSVCASIAQTPPKLPGQECQYINDCALGAGCVAVGESSICLAYCDYLRYSGRRAPQCSSEQLCAPLHGGELIGVCR